MTELATNVFYYGDNLRGFPSVGSALVAGGVMRSTSRVGALWVIAFGLAGIAWFSLELVPPSLGLADGDNPAVALAFLRGHPDIYVPVGIALLLMAITLTVAVHAVADAMAPRFSSLASRSISTIGLFAAAFFFMHGVLRLSGGPLLYIDGLNHDWGEAAYLVVQMMGVQGFAAAGSSPSAHGQLRSACSAFGPGPSRCGSVPRGDPRSAPSGDSRRA